LHLSRRQKQSETESGADLYPKSIYCKGEILLRLRPS